MTTALATDEKGELTRQRERIAEDIEGAWANMQTSVDQLKRRHYYKLGELFIKLRMTYDKGKQGEIAFVAFCRKRFPAIKDPQRIEYTVYRAKIGGGNIRLETSTDVSRNLPPLRRITKPHDNARKVGIERVHAEYGRSVETTLDPELFSIPRGEREVESELVVELAEKIITAGFRVLSTRMHPDNGGSNQAQQRLGEARRMLQRALERESLRR
jgi:hypothetical protein